MKESRHLPEVLAPAGNQAEVTAAILAGADAVYFGGPLFNARLRAENIELQSIKHIVRLCHQNKVKAYITLNILIKDQEWNDVIRYVDFLYHAEIDGMIVQDPGLIIWIRSHYPDMQLQTSTQASIGGLGGVRFFEDLGFYRVVLPREMPIDEIKEIRKKTNIEIKVFIHGALCFSRSGQCLMSSLIGGRSGNRGMCAQPCRKYYRLINESGKVVRKGFLLSMKDLNTVHHIKELVDAGIDALKIEGRLKSPQYVYQVTKMYRNAVDGKKDQKDDQELASVFGRDFTPGRMFVSHQLTNIYVQKKRGAYIGTIDNTTKKWMELQLNNNIQLHCGDGLAFGKDANIGCNVDRFSKQGSKIKMERIPGVKAGMPVYRNKNVALMQRLTEEAERPLPFNKIPISVHMTFSLNIPVFGWVKKNTEGEKRIFKFENIIPQQAKKQALDKEMITQQMKKLGNTDFKLSHLDVNLDQGLFLSRSDLNKIRRQIINMIDQDEDRDIVQNNIRHLQNKLEEQHCKINSNSPKISIQIRNLKQYYTYSHIPADEWVIPLKNIDEIDEIKKIIDDIHKKGQRIRIAFPEIMNTPIERDWQNIFDAIDSENIDGYLVRNYESLRMCHCHHTRHSIEADTNLQIFNAVSTLAFKQWGCDRGVVSPELDQNSLKELNRMTALPLTLHVYGFQEVMISDNCVIDCNKNNCQHCENEGLYHLIDQTGAAFPMILNSGSIHIFNASKLCMTSREIKGLNNVDTYRINVLNEDAEEIMDVAAAYKKQCTQDDIKNIKNKQIRFTTGNFYRGIK
ncbi:U32 family peptidase [Pseudoramibacter sp.]|jgi:putative protease|uniref:U32 family peptidase n=1 Tax=Pseudoramibacter sp. TaxID=2034862 RepID=UPI0025F93B02|nr:U32 family peptidase [Pseudoramibacter sp.]MCH4072941.1 DUF3656 domain-containing protein [Pseudoramibacter sp.]MCH4106712.1 DUF3656 domain-containing protein [Pseudoramibacter sp.]